MRAPDREGERGIGKGNGNGDKYGQQESEARIRATAAEFILSSKDCVYEIVIGFVSWQLFICPRLVPIARHY